MAAAASGGDAVPFSMEALAALRAENRPVFLYFTADWCVTCKANEAAAIDRDAVHKAFDKANIAVMRGDFTRRDPIIARFLATRGRAGVPLYLFYPADGGRAVVLPQILSQDALLRLADR